MLAQAIPVSNCKVLLLAQKETLLFDVLHLAIAVHWVKLALAIKGHRIERTFFADLNV